MKNLACLFCVCALGCAFLAACDWNGEPKTKAEEEQKPTETKAVKVRDEVTAFFEENVKFIAWSVFGENRYDDCVMINSMDEFRKIEFPDDLPPVELPDIDFDTYTLVIGQYVANNGGNYLSGQAVVVEQNVATMNLIIGQKEGLFDLCVYPVPFWALYPKIIAKTIHTNVGYKE